MIIQQIKTKKGIKLYDKVEYSLFGFLLIEEISYIGKIKYFKKYKHYRFIQSDFISSISQVTISQILEIIKKLPLNSK